MGIKNFIMFFCFSLVHANNSCPSSYCRGNKTAINYPFWSEDQRQQNCRPNNFKLNCLSNNITSLYIRNSGEFYVRSIDYRDETISLYDPDNCLLGRLLTLNFSSSPFKAMTTQTYTFLSCPKGRAIFFDVVDCLSNSTTDIVAIKNQSDVIRYSMCTKIVTLQIPDRYYFNYVYGFSEEVELTWDLLTCKDCGSVKTGEKRTRNTSVIVGFSVLIPILVVLVAVRLYCKRIRRGQSHRTSQSSRRADLPSTITTGLDKVTIETYRRVTISEKRDVTGPNDATCAICISDYEPKDTIRFMPECEHCFHVECIDEWLSMNSQCPICRTLQPRVDLSW